MTVFQKIIDRELPADIVFEDDQCLAIKDIAPQAPCHVLIIPKKPLVSLAHTNSEDKALLGHLLSTAAQLARDLGVSERGYRIVINTGKEGGQTVDHLHLHLLGGKTIHEAMA